MKVVVRFQINTKLERVKNLKEFNNLPETTFLPYFWFESSTLMPLLRIPSLGRIGSTKLNSTAEVAEYRYS